MFSFLGRIVNIIEIIIKNERKQLLYLINPEIFNLSKESINYYKNHIDRS